MALLCNGKQHDNIPGTTKEAKNTHITSRNAPKGPHAGPIAICPESWAEGGTKERGGRVRTSEGALQSKLSNYWASRKLNRGTQNQPCVAFVLCVESLGVLILRGCWYNQVLCCPCFIRSFTRVALRTSSKGQ